MVDELEVLEADWGAVVSDFEFIRFEVEDGLVVPVMDDEVELHGIGCGGRGGRGRRGRLLRGERGKGRSKDGAEGDAG